MITSDNVLRGADDGVGRWLITRWGKEASYSDKRAALGRRLGERATHASWDHGSTLTGAGDTNNGRVREQNRNTVSATKRREASEANRERALQIRMYSINTSNPMFGVSILVINYAYKGT